MPLKDPTFCSSQSTCTKLRKRTKNLISIALQKVFGFCQSQPKNQLDFQNSHWIADLSNIYLLIFSGLTLKFDLKNPQSNWKIMFKSFHLHGKCLITFIFRLFNFSFYFSFFVFVTKASMWWKCWVVFDKLYMIFNFVFSLKVWKLWPYYLLLCILNLQTLKSKDELFASY